MAVVQANLNLLELKSLELSKSYFLCSASTIALEGAMG